MNGRGNTTQEDAWLVDVGARIADLISKSPLQAKDWANVGLGTGTQSIINKGGGVAVTILTLRRLSRATGVSMCELLGENTAAKPSANNLAARMIAAKESRELYESLAREFVRLGVASDTFSKLEKLYHLAKATP